ncbi:MAG: peptide chain release factor N(5)-glutamine methyltransferase [Mariniphaga sp.]|nr:peptide chain release factor N(5)-glutamine methyltransferase [Mariniphaga sp.]
MKATIQYIQKELNGLYPETEVKAFTRLILEHVCGLDYTAQVLTRESELNAHCKRVISEIVTRLKQFEPIQYILGETEFFGLKLKVNPAVLIPRPETEELLHWISETRLQVQAGSTVIDIGTGSGCIALGLKKLFPDPDVSAIDFFEETLETARQNAALNNLNVNFFQADILKWEDYEWEKFNLIVSNPPYVRDSEKAAMFPNVLKYEPEKALFVSDSNPLIFYRKIAEFAQKYLIENGWLFFEINENLGKETQHLLENAGFFTVEIKKDLFGKERMIRCRK